MSNDKNEVEAIKLEYSVNPPVGISTESFMEVTTLLSVKELESQMKPLSKTLILIHVGRPPASAKNYLDGEYAQEGQVTDKNAHIHVLNSMSTCDSEQLTQAFARAASGQIGQDTDVRRVLLVVHTLGVELLPVVSGGVSKIVQAGIALDVIAASNDIDYRAWERIAHDGRGQLLVPREGQSVNDVLTSYREALERQQLADVSLNVSLSEHLRYVRVFWAGNEPAFLLDREPAEMGSPLRLNVPVILDEDKPIAAWVLVAIIPRRRSGQYRIMQVELTGKTSNGPITQSLDICHRVSTQPNDARLIDGAVGAEYARVKPSFWVEELGQALSHEDGSRILNLYDPFISWAQEGSRDALVDTLWTAKRAFQRGGYFGTRQLNEFWRMAHHGLPGEG